MRPVVGLIAKSQYSRTIKYQLAERLRFGFETAAKEAAHKKAASLAERLKRLQLPNRRICKAQLTPFNTWFARVGIRLLVLLSPSISMA